jgi:hypothetical protein
MALQVVSPKIAVFKVLGVNDQGQEETEEMTFSRGELLPDWVSSYQQFVLTQTGMCRQVGDFPDPNLTRPEDRPAPVLLPEHDPRAVVGTAVVAPKQVTAPADAEGAGRATPAGELPDLPAEDETKPVWEDYAVKHLGMSRNQAESQRKGDLVADVTKRHAAARKSGK